MKPKDTVGYLVLAGVTYYLVRGDSVATVRERLVASARDDIGKNMRDAVWRDVGPAHVGNPNYCGAWLLYKYRQAGLTNATWQTGLGFVYPIGLRITHDPKPGDVAYWHVPRQHHAMVASTNPLVTIDAAQSGGRVLEVSAPRPTPVYYSIERLL